MGTAVLKKKCIKAIDTIEDGDFLKAVYMLLEQKSKESSTLLTKEQKAELKKNLIDHKQGKLSYYTLQQVKSRAISRFKK